MIGWPDLFQRRKRLTACPFLCWLNRNDDGNRIIVVDIFCFVFLRKRNSSNWLSWTEWQMRKTVAKPVPVELARLCSCQNTRKSSNDRWRIDSIQAGNRAWTLLLFHGGKSASCHRVLSRKTYVRFSSSSSSLSFLGKALASRADRSDRKHGWAATRIEPNWEMIG